MIFAIILLFSKDKYKFSADNDNKNPVLLLGGIQFLSFSSSLVFYDINFIFGEKFIENNLFLVYALSPLSACIIIIAILIFLFIVYGIFYIKTKILINYKNHIKIIDQVKVDKNNPSLLKTLYLSIKDKFCTKLEYEEKL